MRSAELPQLIDEAGLQQLSPDALKAFDTYLGLLLKWNSRLNLTAIRDRETILRRHFIESIQCAQALPQLERPTLLDFGSGAGFPGIPIAICRPEIRVTLAESQRKKATFLRETVRTLGLSAEVFEGRVENMPNGRKFAIIALRAVDRMTETCELAISRVAADGYIVVFSTRDKVGDLKRVLPLVPWSREIPIAGLDQGLLLIGQSPTSVS